MLIQYTVPRNTTKELSNVMYLYGIRSGVDLRTFTKKRHVIQKFQFMFSNFADRLKFDNQCNLKIGRAIQSINKKENLNSDGE